LKARGRLTIRCKDTETARRLEDVLTPDNVGIPKDQQFAMTRDDGSLVFLVDSMALASLGSTLRSILADASLFQKVSLLSSGQDA